MTDVPNTGMLISICILGTRLCRTAEPSDYFEMDDCVVVRRKAHTPPVFDIFMMDEESNIYEASYSPASKEIAETCGKLLLMGLSPVGCWLDEGGVPVSIGNAYPVMHADEVLRAIGPGYTVGWHD